MRMTEMTDAEAGSVDLRAELARERGLSDSLRRIIKCREDRIARLCKCLRDAVDVIEGRPGRNPFAYPDIWRRELGDV